jgi:hypothetical protein
MKKYDRFYKKEYNGTNFLKDIKEPKEGARMPNSEWDVNFGHQKFGDPQCLEHDQFIVSVLHDIASLQNTQKLYWYETSTLRLYIESVHNHYVNSRMYVQRDKITAAAIMIGLPVKLDVNDKSNNKIGLHLTKPTLYKFCKDWSSFMDNKMYDELS